MNNMSSAVILLCLHNLLHVSLAPIYKLHAAGDLGSLLQCLDGRWRRKCASRLVRSELWPLQMLRDKKTLHPQYFSEVISPYRQEATPLATVERIALFTEDKTSPFISRLFRRCRAPHIPCWLCYYFGVLCTNVVCQGT